MPHDLLLEGGLLPKKGQAQASLKQANHREHLVDWVYEK